jgi:hypothetical protein
MSNEDEPTTNEDREGHQEQAPKIFAMRSGAGQMPRGRRHFLKAAASVSLTTGTLAACVSDTVPPIGVAAPTNTSVPPTSAAPTNTNAPPTRAPTAAPTNTSVPPTSTPTPTATTIPASPPSSSPPLLPRNQAEVKDINSNLRSGPGTTFGSQAVLPPRTRVYVLGRNNDGSWLEVRTPTATKQPQVTLYAESQSDRQVATIAKDVDLTVLRRNTEGDWLQVRTPTQVQSERAQLHASPNSTHAAMATVAQGATLAVLAQNDDGTWVEVMVHTGETGWVRSSDVTGDTGWVPASQVTGKTGWVYAPNVDIGFDTTIDALPVVVDVPRPPTVRPKPTEPPPSNPGSPGGTRHYWYPN